MITTDPGHIADQITRAVANPGSLLGRRRVDFGDEVTETVERWSARAALMRIASDFQTQEIVEMVWGVLTNPEWTTDEMRAVAVCVRLAALFGEAAES